VACGSNRIVAEVWLRFRQASFSAIAKRQPTSYFSQRDFFWPDWCGRDSVVSC